LVIDTDPVGGSAVLDAAGPSRKLARGRRGAWQACVQLKAFSRARPVLEQAVHIDLDPRIIPKKKMNQAQCGSSPCHFKSGLTLAGL